MKREIKYSRKYQEKLKRENPELYRQRLNESCQRQREYNAEVKKILEYNKRFPLNRKIITLKKLYITCNNKCTDPTDFKKCENCKQYEKYFDDVRKFKTENQLVYIGR